MCFKPKRDPRIDEEQKKAKAEAKQAKAKAQEEVAAKKAEALEKAKEEQVASKSQVTEGQEYRQAETIEGGKDVAEPETPKPMSKPKPTSLVDATRSTAAMTRSRRASRRGRRSLLTASTAQGYFSRFL